MKRIFLTSIGLLSIVWAVFAADEVSRDVTVQRDYNPTIGQVSKPMLTPDKEDYKPEPPQVKYTTWSKTEEVNMPFNMLKSTDAEIARVYDYKKGVFKAGLGFYWQVLGEFYYPLLQGEKYLLDIDVKHHSNWSNIALEDGTKPRGMSHFTDVALAYEHQFRSSRLAMKADFAYTGYDYYGMSTEPITPLYKDTVGTNSAFEFTTRLFSTDTKKSFQYDLGIEYLYFARNFGISMHEAGLDLDMSGVVGNGRLGGEVKVDVHVTSGLAHAEEHAASGATEVTEGEADAESSQAPAHTAAILTLTPYYELAGDDWGVKIGANLFAHIAAGDVKWPVSGSADISAHVGIVPELFYLYGGISGAYSSNDYYSIVRENKYITPNLEVEPTYSPFDVDLGLKIRIMRGLLFDVNASYRIILNQYYYVNHLHQTLNPSTQVMETDYYTNTFDVVYEPTTHNISVGAGLHFDYVKGLDLSVNANYNLWGVSQQAYAWQKPAWEIGFKGTYEFLEKWQVGASYQYLGGRMAQVADKSVAMNDLHDVNVWASYKALDWLSVFVEGKNLANIQSDVYYGYRSFGINAMAGVTFSF